MKMTIKIVYTFLLVSVNGVLQRSQLSESVHSGAYVGSRLYLVFFIVAIVLLTIAVSNKMESIRSVMGGNVYPSARNKL